jgi:peptidoglycan L-alanyl-D-glutamate endopeptidase CwlK
MAVLGKQSKLNLKGVHPNLVKVIEEAIKDTPIDFSVISGVRTTTEQKALYAQGRTAKGSIVTNADGVKNKSNHQAKSDGYGHAVDLCPYVNGSLDWNTESNFKILSAHVLATAKCLGINVSWGGTWKFKDLPHFELS